MTTNDTGIVMDVEEEVAQENVANVAAEFAAVETTGDSQAAVQDSSDSLAAGSADTKFGSVSSVVDTAVDTEGASGNTPTTEVTEEMPKQDVPTYSQEYVDQLRAEHERDQHSCEDSLRQVKDKLREVENELREKKEKIESIHVENRSRKNNTEYMFSLVGDGSPAKIYELIKKAVELQLEVEKGKKLQNDYDKLEKDNKSVRNWYEEKLQECQDLRTKLNTTKQTLEQKTKDLEEAVSAKNELYAQYEAGERMQKSSVPQCLVAKEWFDAFFKDLKAGLQEDPIFDPAMLVLASLAELAVMERNSANPCFEWKKQLSDIGLVVANYMHHKKSAEEDVLKVLRNFSQAFQEMPILKKLKIVFKVPSLGSDFNTDEVKHKNNGSAIARVLNWCIVEDGHVYCKAIVE